MTENNEEVIFTSDSPIKYRGHAFGAIIEKDDGSGKRIFQAEGCDRIILDVKNTNWLCHPDGVILIDKKSMRFNNTGKIGGKNNKVLASWDNDNFPFNSSYVAKVNHDGSVFYCCDDKSHLYIDNIWHEVETPKQLQSRIVKLDIIWAAMHRSGKMTTAYLANVYGEFITLFFIGDEQKGFILSKDFHDDVYGTTNGRLVYAFNSTAYTNGELVLDRGWDEIKVYSEGFITKEGDKLFVDGESCPVYENKFIDWDVCMGANDIIVQVQTDKGYELRRIAV